jgi:hypothetical protein
MQKRRKNHVEKPPFNMAVHHAAFRPAKNHLAKGATIAEKRYGKYAVWIVAWQVAKLKTALDPSVCGDNVTANSCHLM